jgi:hypothetical protein
MKPDIFYQRVLESVALPPQERHANISRLHTESLADYIQAVRRIDSAKALTVSGEDLDHRTLAQVVAHIMEWDRFSILAAGDILAGVKHPRIVSSIEGYIDTEGKTQHFATIDEFNAYQNQQAAFYSWDQLQALAIDAAETLHTLFTDPRLLNAERLEKTKQWRKRLHNGTIIEPIAMGWSLWIIILQHQAIEHVIALDLSR